MHRIRSYLVSTGLLHKGESVSHLFYLGFAFVEGHGLHAVGAGLVAFFMVLSWLIHANAVVD